MAQASLKLALKKSKETKGTYVFSTDDEGAAVTSIYVRKSAFPDGCPAAIELTITPRQSE